MKVAELEATILETAREPYDKEPEFARQSVLLREVAEKLSPNSVSEEQAILSAWHELLAQDLDPIVSSDIADDPKTNPWMLQSRRCDHTAGRRGD